MCVLGHKEKIAPRKMVCTVVHKEGNSNFALLSALICKFLS